MRPDLIDSHAAAEILGISVPALQKRHARGRIRLIGPRARGRRRLQFLRAEIEAIAQRQDEARQLLVSRPLLGRKQVATMVGISLEHVNALAAVAK